VTSSQSMPPMRPKGRKKPPTPRPTFRVAFPTALLRVAASTLLGPGLGDFAFAAASAFAATCWPAMRPATRSPMPNVRPME
jgi:hypothetical protein